MRTVLVQRNIWSASSANEHFNDRQGNEQCIVLVPRPPIFPQLFFTVPAGPYVLWQSWGKNRGLLLPGLKLCWAPWHRVSHIVTRAAITYDAPTYNVPTADNVMVTVDVSLTFSISGGEDAASDFVYKIGAYNFNDYLSSKTEEAIRGLVYGVTHNKVNDLREEFAVSMLESLKSKMMEFGVRMMNVKVTDVKLPPDLQSRLEKTTAFQTKIEEAAKTQENKKLLIENDSVKKIEALRKENHRKLQDLNAECQRFEIEMREMEDVQRGENKVLETKRRAAAETRITKAKGDKDIATSQGQREAEELLRSTTIRCEAMKIKADQDYSTMVMASKSRLAAAKNTAEGMIATAQAEAAAAEKLREKRKYEIEWKRLAVMEEIAGKGRRVISGNAADGLIEQIVESGLKSGA